MSNFLKPPQLTSAGDVSSNGSSVAGGNSEQLLDGTDVESIGRVMDVLELLMSEVTDANVRNQANHWLVSFQKAKGTSALVLGILFAALLPERATTQQDSYYSGTLQSIGQAQPAAQHQLLFFLAQTLNNKLRRCLGRAADSRAKGEDDAYLIATCHPMDLLYMARRALDLATGVHAALSKCLALAVGQMCVLSIERADGPVAEVAEVLTRCFAAITADADKLRACTNAPMSITAAATSGGDLLNLFDAMIVALENPSADSSFALEIFGAVAAGAKSIANTRGISIKASQAVRIHLTQCALVILTLQRACIFDILQVCARTVKSIGENLGREQTGPHSADIQMQLSLQVFRVIKCILFRFADLGDTAKELFDAFHELTSRSPLHTDGTAVAELVEPVMTLSSGFLATLANMMVQGHWTVVAAHLDDPTAVANTCDAIRSSASNLIEQTKEVLRCARSLACRRTVSRPRRASVTEINSPDLVDVSASRDRVSFHRSCIRSETVNEAIHATEVALEIACDVNASLESSGLEEVSQQLLVRVQLARTLRLLFSAATVPREEDVDIQRAGQKFAELLQADLRARQEEAGASIGRFWTDDSKWSLLPRRAEFNNQQSSNIMTPQELLPRSRKPKADISLQEDIDLEFELQETWSTGSILSRIVLLEEIIGAFCLGQYLRYMGHVAKSIAPLMASCILFSELDSGNDYGLRLFPQGTHCNTSPLTLAAWLLAASIKLTISPGMVSSKVVASQSHFIGARAAANVLSVLCRSIFAERSFLSPYNGDAKQLEKLFHKERWHAADEDGVVQGLCMRADSCWVSAERALLFEEVRGQSVALSGLISIVSCLDSYWGLSGPIRNELRLSDSFATAVKDWCAERAILRSMYPLNLELLTSEARHELSGYRDDYRHAAKSLIKLPLNCDPLISRLIDRLQKNIHPDDQSADWRSRVLACQAWKVVECLVNGFASGAFGSSDAVRGLFADDNLFRQALTHRGSLRSILWFISSMLFTTNTEQLTTSLLQGTLRICRAALRVPQPDFVYPLSANEDHLGAVLLARLAQTIETATTETKSSFVDWLVSRGHQPVFESPLAALAADTLWLHENCASRACSHGETSGQQAQSFVCMSSLSSLALLSYSVSQLNSSAAYSLAHRGLASAVPVNSHFLSKLIEMIQQVAGVAKGRAIAHGILCVEALVAFITSLTCAVSASYPPFARPHCAGLTRLGIKPSGWSWASMNNIPDLDARQSIIAEALRAGDLITQQMLDACGRLFLDLDLAHLSDAYEGRTTTTILEALTQLASVLFASPRDSQRGQVSFVKVIFAFAEASATASAIYSSIDPLVENAGYEINANPSSSTEPETTLETVCQCLSHTTFMFLRGLTSPGAVTNLEALARISNNALGRFVTLLKVYPIARDLAVLAQILGVVSLFSAALSIYSNSSGVPESFFGLCSLWLKSNDPESRSSALTPINQQIPFVAMLPTELESVIFQFLSSSIQTLHAKAAHKGASKSMASASIAASMPSTPAPSPAEDVRFENLRELPVAVWLLTGLLNLQAAMAETPSISHVALTSAQNTTISLFMCFPDFRDVTSLLTASRSLCVNLDPTNTPPIRCYSSNDNLRLFRADLQKHIQQLQSPSPQNQEPGASDASPGGQRRQSLPTTFSTLVPRSPTSSTSPHPSPEAIFTAFRKTLRRHTTLVNIVKRRKMDMGNI